MTLTLGSSLQFPLLRAETSFVLSPYITYPDMLMNMTRSMLIMTYH
jgi:hypothetical protein